MSKINKSLTDDEIDKLSLNVVRLLIVFGFGIVLLCAGGCVWLMWIVTKAVTA